MGSQPELDDYNRMHNEADPDLKRELIERFVRDYPKSGLLAYVYQDGFYLGRRANDLKIMTLYGEKSLQIWPGNYTLLTELAGVYVQRNLLEEAEAKATAALKLLDRAARPSNIPEQQWTADMKVLLSRNHVHPGICAPASSASHSRCRDEKNRGRRCHGQIPAGARAASRR